MLGAWRTATSLIEESKSPPSWKFLILFEKMLSRRVPFVSVIRVGRKIDGRNEDEIKEFKDSFLCVWFS